MAFDKAPSSLFTGLSEDGTDLTIPIASITDLTDTEADGTTGDWRALMLRIVDHVYAYYGALATADKPAKFTIARTRRESGTSIIYGYRIDIATDVEENAVTAEA